MREAFFPHGITDGVTIELFDFVTAVRDLTVAEAIYESDAAHRPVAVQDMLDGTVDAYQRPIDEHWQLV